MRRSWTWVTRQWRATVLWLRFCQTLLAQAVARAPCALPSLFRHTFLGKTGPCSTAMSKANDKLFGGFFLSRKSYRFEVILTRKLEA